MRIGVVIRRWRKMEERDVSDVAKEIGVSASTLTRLESGQTPNGETLAAVLTWLMTDPAPPASPAPVAPTEERTPADAKEPPPPGEERS